MDTLAEIRLGTSSFTAAGWESAFYPKGIKSADRLPFYAQHFDTVEIDSTFYACPSPRTVEGWAAKTPDDFIFSVKVPQIITHEKVLVGCDIEFKQFVETMGILEEKLGPMVLQFPRFDRSVFKSQMDFLDRLIPFLNNLPKHHRYAIEIRNNEWLDAQLAGCCEIFGLLSSCKIGHGCFLRTSYPRNLIRLRRIGHTSGGWLIGKRSNESPRLGTKR